MNGSCQKVWCMSVKKVPYITPWPLLHMAWNRLDRLLFLKKSMDNNPKQHEPSYWELSFSCYCNSTTLPSSTSICCQYSAITRGAPKPGKTPIMAVPRRCLLFFKIEVRPRSCWSYNLWRPWLQCLTKPGNLSNWFHAMRSRGHGAF